MDCAHKGFHGFGTDYDHRRGLLVYYWVCESCGTRLGDARQEEYRPAFDPRGNDPYLVPATR